MTKHIPFPTAGELARALKWKADENRGLRRKIMRGPMRGPHDEKVLGTAIAALLGQGYEYDELSTAYGDLMSEHQPPDQAASGLAVSDALTITEIPPET